VVSTDFEVFSKIKKGEYRSLPMSTSEDLRDIVKQIWNRKTRPTLENLKSHMMSSNIKSPLIMLVCMFFASFNSTIAVMIGISFDE